MKTKILSVLTILLSLGYQNAEAAKLEKMIDQKSKALTSAKLAWGQMCFEYSDWERTGNTTCTYTMFKVLSRSRSEKWSAIVKQSIFMNGDGYIDVATASALKNNETTVYKKIDSILKDAGYDRSSSVLNQKIGFVKKTLKDEMIEQEAKLIFKASYQHEYGNGLGLYLIDESTDEMLEVFFNYSE